MTVVVLRKILADVIPKENVNPELPAGTTLLGYLAHGLLQRRVSLSRRRNIESVQFGSESLGILYFRFNHG